MGHTVVDLTTSTSTSLNEKNEYNAEKHFRWDSIKKFIYLANIFSSSLTNFDIFSKVLYERARFLDFIFFEFTIGMSYMCMDFFIKQYTRKLDFNESLNPLLRGISAGILLQTSVWTIIHASDLADAMRYLITSFYEVPSWAKCYDKNINTTCLSSRDVIVRCHFSQKINLSATSAHINYNESFRTVDRASLTTRFFVVAIVWICNFFIATIQDTSILKLFKLAFIWKILSTSFLVVFILFSRDNVSMAVLQIFDVTEYTNKPYHSTAERVAHAFGIGFIGVYDFGTISPYMMVDNAIIIFTVIFTAVAFARSFIIQILYFELTNCMEIEIAVTPHYLFFAILPLSTEFLNAHKIYALYMYLNITTMTTAYVAMLTLSISRLLRSEFRSVNNVYVIGILCFLGFGLTLPIAVLKTDRMVGLMNGLNVTALYLGGFKVAVVMWVYGVERFCTDIHFLLGFRPTKFWRICWMLLPAILFIAVFNRVQKLIYLKDVQQKITAIVWISFLLLTVLIFHIRTLASYIMKNNLGAAFRNTVKYGPPEPEDRRRRRKFDVTLNYQQCKHDCLLLDDKIDCNHLPLIFQKKEKLSDSSDSESSLTNIYEAGPSKRRPTSVIDMTANYG
ncbi:uncharacterized protein [Epargyreus clarus]|uniref:uncharacterized protein isoform X2 n=1 Tax=Epargyreus clarus TaxID=520877 RepID=UPI003C2CED3A